MGHLLRSTVEVKSRRTETLIELFQKQAAQTPKLLALSAAAETMTYEELDRSSDALAATLIKTVGPENVVAVLLPRCIDAVICILAVFKCGAIYLPIDPGHPGERIEWILNETKPACTLTHESYRALLPTDAPSFFLDQYEIKERLRQFDVENRGFSTFKPICCEPSNAAYLLYTSGSTGLPKPVVGIYGGLANRISWFNARYPTIASGVVLARSSPGFIDAITELISPLLQGAHVLLAATDQGGDPFAIARLVEQHSVERITLTPSLLTEMLTDELMEMLGACKLWISSGERLPESTIARFNRSLPAAKLVNLYGCSEASGDSLYEDSGPVPNSVGFPIWNTEVRVLSEDLQLCLPGTQGHLFLCGGGLARGYLKFPGLTAARFVADPFRTDGSRMYFTGDLVSVRHDGALEFAGRADQQIKIRGVRVEIAEVERTLRRLLPVLDAVAVGSIEENGENRLEAYVRLRPGILRSGSELRRELQKSVPSHYIPDRIRVLEKLPYTLNGKVDRRALLVLPNETASEYSSPGTPEEHILCSIVAEVLGVASVGVDSSFFDLEANSLTAVRIASRIRTELKVHVAIAKILEADTISRLAQIIRSGETVTRPQLKPR